MNFKNALSSAGNKFLFLLLFILLSSRHIYSQTTIVNDVIILPSYPLDPLPNKVLVLSTVDLKERLYRSSKEELFEDALFISRENGVQYLRNFFPYTLQRTRNLFVKKEFSNVKVALANKDYDKALEESQRYTHDANRKIAAKANYNCAVLMEKKQRPDLAKLYLQESLGLFLLVDAMMLKQDYGITTGWMPLPNQ